MVAIIKPSKLKGNVKAIPSKSIAHRLLICASLSDSGTSVNCSFLSKDIEATIACLNSLNADIKINENGFLVSPIKNIPKRAAIDCSESGSTLRFLLPIVSALGIECKVTAGGRLPSRPIDTLLNQLKQHGCSYSQDTLPFVCSGKLSGGEFTLPGNISSQFISGLLFALPLLETDSLITITEDFQSKSYVDLTLYALEQFKIYVKRQNKQFLIKGNQKYVSPKVVNVEGDWSNAAFWLVAGALSDTPISCTNLNLNSLQGDKKIIDVLKQFGAKIKIESSCVTVEKGNLTATKIDAAEIPDLIPIISLVAAVAKGKTVIKNAGRLRIKESDRLAAITKCLNSFNAKVEELKDGLEITGVNSLKGATVDSFNDHRIAMMCTIASIVCDGDITITNAKAVEKSYPDFFDDFKSLGGSVSFKEE